MKRKTGIDIVVPVYNALDDLKLCVESLKKHTDLTLDRVVLIDDRSPDKNVFPYLKSIEQEGIIVLQNEKNQGFSGTVNRGMEYAGDRDVILLNTDTIVTKNWVDKITACAYSDPAIATVTPFSNNATLCSIPNFCEENVVPYGLTIDEYAAIIEQRSMKKYPRITVAVGFCMFIKREVIDRVGLFDKETFQRGYGEENDFCWRAEQLGYHHVLCDDTYIYHSGTVSFQSEEKRKLIAEHERVLVERYPKQVQKNAEYVRDNPHQYLRTNVDLYAKLHNDRKNLLYVLHMDFRSDANNNIGGTQFHVKDLVADMRRENNVFVLARDGEILRLTVYLEKEQFTFTFCIGTKQLFQQFEDQEIRKVFCEILSAFSIDLVHIHHVIDLSFDLFKETKARNIPLLLTLHDYYYICPTIKLLENGTSYCAASGKQCTNCLNKTLGYAKQVPYLSVWREKCREALALCDMLIAPSEAAKAVYAKVYPEMADHIRVIPHGMDAFPTTVSSFRRESTPGFELGVESVLQKDNCISGWAIQKGNDSRHSDVFVLIEDEEGKRCEYQALTKSRPDVAKARGSNDYLYSGFSVQLPDGYFASGNLKMQVIIQNHNGKRFYSKGMLIKNYVKREKQRRRIAFLGGLNEAKGSQIAYEMIKQSGDQYDWYIIGGIGDPNLHTLEKKNVHKTGWYKRESVNTILRQNRIDLVCILPIWPETFCYTVSEAQLAGVPVLATDIGALGDRLRQDKTGWLIRPEAGAKGALRALEDIFADTAKFQQVRAKAAEFRHRSIAEMNADYAALYNIFAKPEKQPADYDTEAMYHAYLLGQADQSMVGSGSAAALIQRVNELEATLNAINQSIEYKMVKFFNRENMPFKRQIKWSMGAAYRAYVKFFR